MNQYEFHYLGFAWQLWTFPHQRAAMLVSAPSETVTEAPRIGDTAALLGFIKGYFGLPGAEWSEDAWTMESGGVSRVLRIRRQA